MYTCIIHIILISENIVLIFVFINNLWNKDNKEILCRTVLLFDKFVLIYIDFTCSNIIVYEEIIPKTLE